MSYSIFTVADATERRKARRSRCAADVEVRQQGRFAVPATLADLNRAGGRIAGGGPFIPGFRLMLRLPGEANRACRIVWSEGRNTGVTFESRLESDVFAGLVTNAPLLRVVSND